MKYILPLLAIILSTLLFAENLPNNTRIVQWFDCFSVKPQNSVNAISYEKQKNIRHLLHKNLAPLSESETTDFAKLYPEAVKLCDYYPLSAFLSKDNEVAILLFEESYEAEKKSNLIIQTLYKNKAVTKINLSETFKDFSIKDFKDKVTFSDGFAKSDKGLFYEIMVFKKPQDIEGEYGIIRINPKGVIQLEGGSGIP